MTDLFSVAVDWSKPTLAITSSWWALAAAFIVAITAILVMYHRRKVRPKHRLDSVEVTLHLLKVAEVKGTWTPNDNERRVAWELYSELVTRSAVVELQDGQGLLREALTSLHSLFQTTRALLRQYGPEVAQPKADGELSFGYLAVLVLNEALRPFLSKWHPELQAYEALRQPNESVLNHERLWGAGQQCREELQALNGVLAEYAELLAAVAGVPSLTTEQKIN